MTIAKNDLRSFRYPLLILLLASSPFLFACKTSSYPWSKCKKDTNPIAQGIAYYLPQRTFNVVVDYEITSCTDANNKLEYDYNASSKVNSEIVADPSKTYYISLKRLNGFTKSVDYSFSLYDNSTLKSGNGKAEDKSLVAVSNLIKAGFAISSPLEGLMGGGVLSAQPSSIVSAKKPLCSEEVKKALKRKKTLQAKIKAEEKIDKKRDEAKVVVKLWKERLEFVSTALKKAIENGDGKKIKALMELAKEWDAKLSAAKIKLGKFATSKTPSLNKELSKLRRDTLSISVGLFIKPEFSDVYTPDATPTFKKLVVKAQLPFESVKKWLTADGYRVAIKSGKEFKAEVEVGMVGEPTGKLYGKNVSKADGGKRGLMVYRQPAPARLRVCKDSCRNLSNGIDAKNILHSATYNMPQFGITAGIPLQAKFADDVALKFGISSEGALVSAGYQSKSQAEAISSLVLESAEQYQQFRKDRHESLLEQRDEERSSEIESIEHQIELQKKLLELEQAKDALSSYE